VVLRAKTHADGSTVRQFDVPGPGGTTPTSLDQAGFNVWLRAHVPRARASDLVSMLVIEEVLDHHLSIVTCSLERHLGSPTGPFHGEPARVTFTGAAEQIRLYRTTPDNTLVEMQPRLDRRPLPPSRVDHLARDEEAIRNVFGAAVRILDAREPTVLEDLISVSSVVHLRTPDGTEIDCGVGWHGTTPFVLRAEFPRFGAAPDLPAANAAAIAMAAVTAGLTTFETRTDANGPAMVARSAHSGAFHLIRPEAGGARIEDYTPSVPTTLLNADQAIWARYVQAHENLTLVDAYRDGRSDNVYVLAGASNGRVTRHLIDADGTEVWRAAADDTAAAALHRERVIGAAHD